MRKTHLPPAAAGLILATIVAVAGIGGLRATDGRSADSAPPFKAHPLMFSMIQCWMSDTESPVATEINLDAVESNRNQFSSDEVKQEEGWTVCREAGAKGFKRYRLLESKSNRYKVEYQENGGGTLTTASIIEFSLGQREIRKNGKPTTLRVLRVDAYSSK